MEIFKTDALRIRPGPVALVYTRLKIFQGRVLHFELVSAEPSWCRPS